MTQKCSKQVRSILDYIAEENPHAAIAAGRKIEEAAAESLAFPYPGRPAPVEGLRVFCIPRLPYLIVYSVRENVVEIATLWHGRQDWMH